MMSTNWDSLPDDVHDSILNKLEFKDLFRCTTMSKKRIESDDFYRFRGASSSQEGSFTAIIYYIEDNAWQCLAYDLHSNSCRSLPPFPYIPIPNAHQNFRIYSSHRSLMCAEVSKLPNVGYELVVFNPLSGKKKILPPLLYPRNPLLIHISINSAAKSYTIIVAGSCFTSEKHLSKKVEVFHSTTSKWTEASDLPFLVFGLNEHQRYVCVNGVLHVIAVIANNGRVIRLGVIAFDMENGKWLEDMTCDIPFGLFSPIVHLIECDGNVYLYRWEISSKRLFLHFIDVLECQNLNTRVGAWHWRNVVRVRKRNRCRWTLYNEYSCVNFGDGKLCMFNKRSRTGVVYDMQDGKQFSVLAAPPRNEKGEKDFTLNPAPFSLQPCFDNNLMSSAIEIIENKDAESVAEYWQSKAMFMTTT